MMSGAGPMPGRQPQRSVDREPTVLHREPKLEALIARMVEAVHLQVVGRWGDRAVEFRREQGQQAAALVAGPVKRRSSRRHRQGREGAALAVEHDGGGACRGRG